MTASTIAEAGWDVARPRTLVDHAVESILSAAARGLILPGDRLSEPELTVHLGISRVPIREALRILESQGVVTSEPYKGIRLMEVSRERLQQVTDVRAALETLACCRTIEHGRNRAADTAPLDNVVDEMVTSQERGDAYRFAAMDTQFHRLLCSLAGNPVLSTLWESIARQLTIIIGLSTIDKAMASIVEEHRVLLRVLRSGDIAAMKREIDTHIRVLQSDTDYASVIAERRAALAARRRSKLA